MAPLAKGFVRYRWLSESCIFVFQINRHPKSPEHAYHNTPYGACQVIYYICIGKSTGRESPKRTSCMSVPGPGQLRRHVRLTGAARCSLLGLLPCKFMHREKAPDRLLVIGQCIATTFSGAWSCRKAQTFVISGESRPRGAHGKVH